LYWGVCTKQGTWAVMYKCMCISDIYFAYFLDFLLDFRTAPTMCYAVFFAFALRFIDIIYISFCSRKQQTNNAIVIQLHRTSYCHSWTSKFTNNKPRTIKHVNGMKWLEEIGKIYIANTHTFVHDSPCSLLGTYTSIQCGGVKLVPKANTSPPSQMIPPWKCFTCE
jgi:hypothetical protein